MNEADALEIVHRTISVVMLVSAPLVIVATMIGLLIALLQALTQIQEMTLTFVPKIVGIMVTLSLSAPYIARHIHELTQFIYSRIERGF
jgi:flagellar biosynthetic protein FliQ